MATGRIAGIEFERHVLSPVGRVASIHFTRTPPAPPAPVGRIGGIWFTRGYNPPVTGGGWWVCFDGETWTRCEMRVCTAIGVWS